MDDIITPALSAAGGAITVAGLSKVMIQRWFQKNEENHERWGTSIQNILITLTRIEERVSTLQRTEERTRQQDTILAVVQSQLSELKSDLNGVGRKIREMQAQ